MFIRFWYSISYNSICKSNYTTPNKGMKFGISGLNGLWLKFIVGTNNVLGVTFSTTFFIKFPMVAFLWILVRYLYWNICKNAKFETLGPFKL